MEVKDLVINAFCEIHPEQRLEPVRGRPLKGTPPGVRMKCPKCVVPVFATVKCELPSLADPLPTVESPPLPQFPCKKHPERESIVDKLGRPMGLCKECLSERGRASGLKGQYSGRTGPPVSIPLNQERFAEIKTWLEESAKENERTMNEEIMYRLKMAMRREKGL